MKARIIVASLFSLLLIAGCASTDSIVMDSTKRPPTMSVDVYKNGESPSKPFKEIAELSFLGPREDELRAERFFISKAKKMGGNGVLFETVPAGERGGGSIYGFQQSTAWVFKGKVIVYQ